MEVGAIGGAIGGAGMSMGVGGAAMGSVSSVGGNTVGGTQAGQSAMPGEISARLQQLADLIQGFSSAEILMALMMMRGDDDKKSGGAGAALGLLAGMAIAGQLQQMMPAGGFGNAPDASLQGFGSGMGVSINFTV
jgi:hypothetical protein